MADEQIDLNFELICIIVNFGVGTKIVSMAKKIGLPGGTVFLGRGTAKNKLLEMLDLCDVRKEIVFVISQKSITERVAEELSKKFAFDRPNHGIAFTISVKNFIGCKDCAGISRQPDKGDENLNDAIFVIVEKGKADDIIDAANKAGSTGGTIINARGSGIHETQKIFAMPIEPEKEIVMIISAKDKTDKILDSVKLALDIEVPGNGMLFVVDVNKTYGLFTKP